MFILTLQGYRGEVRFNPPLQCFPLTLSHNTKQHAPPPLAYLTQTSSKSLTSSVGFHRFGYQCSSRQKNKAEMDGTALKQQALCQIRVVNYKIANVINKGTIILAMAEFNHENLDCVKKLLHR